MSIEKKNTEKTLQYRKRLTRIKKNKSPAALRDAGRRGLSSQPMSYDELFRFYCLVFLALNCQ